MGKILIIDDMEYIRKNISKVLGDCGHTVFEAANGNEGTRILKREQIDLLITDIVMPNKGGVEILMDLRETLRKTKIIVITGEVSPEAEAFKSLVKKFGASMILYKPFKKEVLLQTVDKLLTAPQ